MGPILRWQILIYSIVCSVGFAQENSTSVSLPPVESTQTSSTSVNTVKSPWQASLGSETYTYEIHRRQLGAQAPIVSHNWVGAIYNLNPRWALELRQHFQIASNKENLTGRDKVLNQDSLAIAETMLNLSLKTGGLWGSKPGTIEFKYYAPTDRAAQLNKELGLLRANAYYEWML